MAHLDPRAIALRTALPTRFTLKIHDVAPERIEPNGDRYIVEVIDLDESVLLGQLLVVTQDPTVNPNDPQRDPTVERRGVLAAVVLRGGNGHLLGLPDWARPAGTSVVRDRATVPMFFAPGDVVFVDVNARGRDLKILGKEVRLVGQIDILARLEGVRLVKNAQGAWEQTEG